MGRFGTPEKAAAAIAFLASDDSGFIATAALPLDGGIRNALTVPGNAPPLRGSRKLSRRYDPARLPGSTTPSRPAG